MPIRLPILNDATVEVLAIPQWGHLHNPPSFPCRQESKRRFAPLLS